MTGRALTTYTVDVVFCIDVTASMTPYLEQVKMMALNFSEILEAKMVTSGRTIENLRARIVWFRDLETGDDAIGASPFFTLPDQQAKFAETMSSLNASGGGTYPESSLEGLWRAMNSEWQTAGSRRRHVIVMATDDAAHPLGKFSYELEQDPFPTPKNNVELQKRWGIPGMDEHALMDKNARRLVLFAPDKDPWPSIGDTWQNTLYVPSTAGSGISDIDMEQICAALAASV
jgi:hypothetical protein